MSKDQYYQNPQVSELKTLQDAVLGVAQGAGVDSSAFPSLRDPDLISRVQGRLNSEFTIMVIGQVSSGKSSFINSLLGRRFFIPSHEPTDGMISLLLPAKTTEDERAERVFLDGSVEPFNSIEEGLKFVRQGETAVAEHQKCREVRFYVCHPLLRTFRFVNTPGLGDRLRVYEEITCSYLNERESDLIIWTFDKNMPVNRDEVEFFGKELRRRAGSIIGLMTSSLAGREDDLDYSPLEDPQIMEESFRHVEDAVGDYIEYLIPYDSHVARRALKSRGDELESDKTVEQQLERSGYMALQDILTEIVGTNEEEMQAARVELVERTLKEHAYDLGRAVDQSGELLKKKLQIREEKIEEWNHVEREIIGPLRENLREKIRQLAGKRAEELVELMADAAEQAVEENFGLVGTLFRLLGGKIKLCDPVAAKLNATIEEAIEAEIAASQFMERLEKEVDRVTRDELLKLENQLQEAVRQSSEVQGEQIHVGAGATTANAEDISAGAIAAGAKGIIQAVLKTVAKKLEKIAIQKAAQESGKTAGRVTAGAMATKAAGVITLVLVPFDLYKMVKEFKRGKTHLQKTIRSRYKANRAMYAVRITDSVMPGIDDLLDGLLENARNETFQHRSEKQSLLDDLSKSSTLSKRLERWVKEFGK